MRAILQKAGAPKPRLGWLLAIASASHRLYPPQGETASILCSFESNRKRLRPFGNGRQSPDG